MKSNNYYMAEGDATEIVRVIQDVMKAVGNHQSDTQYVDRIEVWSGRGFQSFAMYGDGLFEYLAMAVEQGFNLNSIRVLYCKLEGTKWVQYSKDYPL